LLGTIPNTTQVFKVARLMPTVK